MRSRALAARPPCEWRPPPQFLSQVIDTVANPTLPGRRSFTTRIRYQFARTPVGAGGLNSCQLLDRMRRSAGCCGKLAPHGLHMQLLTQCQGDGSLENPGVESIANEWFPLHPLVAACSWSRTKTTRRS
jgi:hypothetical protein